MLLLGPSGCKRTAPHRPGPWWRPGSSYSYWPCLSVVLLQLGSVLMSIAHVSTEAHVNHMPNHVLKYKGHTELPLPLNGLGRATHSSLKSWPYPLKGAGMAEPMISSWESWPLPHHKHRRIGSVTHLKGVIPASQTDPLRTWSWHTPTSTSPMTCWSVWRDQSWTITTGSSCTTAGYRRGMLVGSSIVYVLDIRGLEPDQQCIIQWTLAKKTVWTNGLLHDT